MLRFIKKYWPCLLYIIVSYFSSAAILADTFKYIDGVIQFEKGQSIGFVDFSHFLWRPLGYVIHQLSISLHIFQREDVRSQVSNIFFSLTWVFGFVSIIVFANIFTLLKIRDWAKNVTFILLIFSNAF